MISTRIAPVLLIASLGTVAPTAIYGASASFLPLGDLDGGVFRSYATAVSADGRIVAGGGTKLSTPLSETTRWELPNPQPDPLRDVFVDDGFSRGASAVSADGRVIAGITLDRSERFVYGNKAFRWTAAGGFENLAPLAGDISATTSDMSEDGKIVVGVSRGSSNFMMAVLWDSTGAVQSLGTLPTDPRLTAYSGASGVSADGSIVVGDSTSGYGSEAFLWTASGGMVGLGVLPGAAALASGANGISTDGSTVVGMSFSQSFPTSGEAMLWTAEGGMRGLGVLRDSDVSSSALFTSSDGAIVFGSSQGFDDSRAFVWDARFGMRDFRGVLESEYDLAGALAGWSDIVPHDVSGNALVIVGSGINPDGNLEAWAVTLDRPMNVPEPYGVALIMVVLVASAAIRRSQGSHEAICQN